MRGRDEAGFELRRREQHAVLPEPAKPGAKLRGVGPFRGVVVADRVAGEERGQHRAHPIDGDRHVGRGGGGPDGGRGPIPCLLQLLIAGGIESFERCQSGGYGQRVSGQRAGLVHRAGGRDLLHDVAPTSIGADGKPAAEHLPQAGEIRRHAVQFLGAAPGQPKSGDHLVEDQQRPLVSREPAQSLQETGLGWHDAHVPRHRFNDDRRDLSGPLSQRHLDVRQRIEASHQRVLRGARRDTRGCRDAEGSDP